MYRHLFRPPVPGSTCKFYPPKRIRGYPSPIVSDRERKYGTQKTEQLSDPITCHYNKSKALPCNHGVTLNITHNQTDSTERLYLHQGKDTAAQNESRGPKSQVPTEAFIYMRSVFGTPARVHFSWTVSRMPGSPYFGRTTRIKTKSLPSRSAFTNVSCPNHSSLPVNLFVCPDAW